MLLGWQSISFACLCSKSLKEYKVIIRTAIKHSENIYVAEVSNPKKQEYPALKMEIEYCVINPVKTWKGNVKTGDLIGQVPDDRGVRMVSSCDRSVMSNSTYLFLTTGDRLELCTPIILLENEQVDKVVSMDLKHLKKFLFKTYRENLKMAKTEKKAHNKT